MPGRNDIPDKVYFRIGEVSDLVGVDTHVLRYWETEFKQIRPRRAKSKQRLYRKKDVENLLLIKSLLYDDGYTISGARSLLKKHGQEKDIAGEVVTKDIPIPTQSPSKSQLTDIKKELRKIQQILAMKSLRF